jgi:hypothetical protein
MFTNIVHIEDQYKFSDIYRRNCLMLMTDMFVHVDKDLVYKQHMVVQLDLNFVRYFIYIKLVLRVYHTHITVTTAARIMTRWTTCTTRWCQAGT